MKLSSMTGFARHSDTFSYKSNRYSWTWEIKSVNAKNMDIKVRLPQWLNDLDESVKGICAKVFARGTFNVTLDIESSCDKPQICIDESLLQTLIEHTKSVYKDNKSLFNKPSPAELLNVDGVIKISDQSPDEDELTALKQALGQSMFAAAKALKSDRQKEGKKIGKVLTDILEQIKQTTISVKEVHTKSPEKIKNKIIQQIHDLSKDITIPEERLAQEALLLILRADVKEEIDRLLTHVNTAQELLQSEDPIGRRLDFLCQELNREANTLCSKSMDIEQTQYGLTLKALIEQFREQIQNME